MEARLNKFAELAPDYEEEEKKRREIEAQNKKKEAKKEAKKEVEQAPKEEAAPVQPVEANKEQVIHEQPQRGQGYRGNRYRGSRGSYRGRGVEYVRKGTDQQRDSKDFRFHGSNDPVHPYDRKSGTGRGTEISKEGKGKGGWGKPGDEHYYEEPLIEEKKEIVSPPVPEAKKEEEAKQEGEKATQGKRKRRKEDKKEEKEEEDLDKDGTALTFKEYQAKLAEKSLIVKEKKPEEKVVLDPKKAEKVVAYVKPSFVPKANKPHEETQKVEKEVQPAAAIEGLNLLGK